MSEKNCGNNKLKIIFYKNEYEIDELPYNMNIRYLSIDVTMLNYKDSIDILKDIIVKQNYFTYDPRVLKLKINNNITFSEVQLHLGWKPNIDEIKDNEVCSLILKYHLKKKF